MIHPRLACAVLALAVHSLALAQAPPANNLDPPAFAIEPVAPGVYVHFGQPLPLDAPGHDDIANIGFIIGSRCAAVIDTGGSVRIGRALRAALARLTSLPVCYVINTHVHVDHVLGDAAFADTRASFVGHAALATEMVRNRSFFLTQFGADLDQPPTPTQIVTPDRTVTGELSLDLGGRPLRLRAWPTAHTNCDLSVLDEHSGTLWTGDLLFRQRLPAIDGDVAGWLRVIDQLALLKVRRAVPGHGPLATDLAAALQPEKHYLQTLLADVRQEIDSGQSLQHAIDHAAESERPQWLLWDSTHPHNVSRVYEQLEWQ